MTSKAVKDTRPQWEIDREKRETVRNVAADHLLPEQVAALLQAMNAIRNADLMLHETYELDVDAMKDIDTSEWKLRNAFPGLYEIITINED